MTFVANIHVVVDLIECVCGLRKEVVGWMAYAAHNRKEVVPRER